MKVIWAALAGVVLSACNSPHEGPDLARRGDTLFIRGMALAETTTGSAKQYRQVVDCQVSETLAPITGPTEYCRLNKPDFLGARTTNATAIFGGDRLTSIHINAPTEAFEHYVASFTAALGQPTSPKPDAQGRIPHGEANITDGEGRHVLSDYRIWRAPIAEVRLYEYASEKTGQLSLFIGAPGG